MRTFLALILLSFSLAAHADRNCGGLKAYDGIYEQTSTTCSQDERFVSQYKYVVVESSTVDTFQQTWIYHRDKLGPQGSGFGIGPTNDTNDIYGCSFANGTFTVNDPMPYRSYNFG